MNTFWHTAVEIHNRLADKALPYCIIKSYGGDPEYSDGNIDVVTSLPFATLYRTYFSNDFCITARDRLKNVLYERNKLMLTPNTDRFCKIHLHSNIGWHNYCFINRENVFEHAHDKDFEGHTVRVLGRDLEARAFVLHIIFEQFKKNAWDMKFLSWDDFAAFATEYEIDASLLKPVFDTSAQEIELELLKPIWKHYYSAQKSNKISWWSLFLHKLFVHVQSRRREKNMTN